MSKGCVFKSGLELDISDGLNIRAFPKGDLPNLIYIFYSKQKLSYDCIF